ncbi:MAG: Ig-like domain repeat protein [Betaproteobacteria bacterium]|nr:Ig-like domain repeat protein [Betaproteobacteria bacterium]
MFVPSLIFKQLGECLRLACCALLMLLTSQAAAIQSTITVVADRGPIDVGGRATFTAHVQPTTYRVCTAVGYDLSTFQTVYVRYDIPGSTFLQNVSFSDLADVMTSANVANDIIVQGGTPADNFVVFQVVAGTAGMPASDLFCFRLPGVNFGTGNPNPYVAYSLHLSAISAAGPNPVNTTRASVYGPVDLGVFASTPAPSGAVMFEVDSAPVPGCTAQPVVSGGASCTITFGITGVHVVVANYSGDGAYSGSLGALAGGQTVNIVLPSAVPDGIVGSLYFFAVVATGAATSPFPFWISTAWAARRLIPCKSRLRCRPSISRCRSRAGSERS